MEKSKEIFKVITGSQSYGTNLPDSDIDHKRVHVQNPDFLLGFGYEPNICFTKDDSSWEIRFYIEMLMKNTPGALEILFSPDDCIINIHPAFELIREHKQKFLTKKCFNTFSGYGKSQIEKAYGLNKKINWDEKDMVRKTPIDFCYVIDSGQSIPLKEYFERTGLKQELCGCVSLDHMRYSTHCKKYKEFEQWKRERNETRYVHNTTHGQKYDSKNIMHLVRLIETAREIATEGTIKVRRSNREELLAIRRGEVNLSYIVDKAKEQLIELEELFQKSSLPDNVDQQFCHELILQVRKEVTFD